MRRGSAPAPSPGRPFSIRPARRDDVPLIYGLIRELAEYERGLHQVTGSEAHLQHWLFGPQPAAEALIAERDGEPLGFALFHGTFSTWECRPGVWLEDLYIRPEQRRGGVGLALLREVARITVERGGTRLAWTALGWNTPALDFYAAIGAERLAEWQLLRVDGEALAELASAP